MRTAPVTGARRGFTLVELIVGMVVFAVVGAALTGLLTTQGRFFDKQGMANAARNVSRASLNRIVSDFRMIEATGGVVAASGNSLTVRVPFALGVVCANSIGTTVVSLLPVDSVMFAQPGFYGFAWRNAQTGVYTYIENPATQAVGNTDDVGICTTQNVTTLTNGKIVAITPIIPVSAGLGTPVFLYRKVRYEFKSSGIVPGRTGLYRTVIFPDGTETAEELVAPFANTARFRFFVFGNSANAQDAPPALLSSIRGIELHLDGTSETIAATKTSVEQAPFTTAVFFKNTTN